ncbi:hypothetical protein RM697_04185 [Ichthyenterobacterium sp. W332]|uniref:Uncharacterized protein n=1 Tax=Microcosmobacter mediterraneus TaxID=3075607 RepID=A0ABU2YKR7_9FLAO|nr:hypothetical protein [Ichthyenterobacterium sp. W332]MDT0557830.1 hypothetical protein [Ichthyenterobacterium sp. W332]
MKKITFLFLVLSSLQLIGQNTNTNIEILTHTLAFEDSIIIENITLEFSKLSPDSRCPKEVMCIRAGEAIATVTIYIDNVLKKTLDLTFYPHGVSEELSKFLSSEGILLGAFELLPYPKADRNQINANYLIRFNQEIIN